MKKITLLALILISNFIHAQNPLMFIQTRALGNRDASQAFQEMSTDASQAYGLSGCAVKKLEPFLGGKLLKRVVTSCPGLGKVVWIYESAYANASKEEKIFSIFHEIAHVNEGHPWKISVLYGVVGAAYITTAYATYDKLPVWAYAALLLAQAAVSHTIAAKQIEETEKEADLIAARRLQAVGRSDVVRAHIATLDAHKVRKDSMIFPSEGEQAQYLQPYASELTD